MPLTAVSLRIRFTDHDEVIIPLDAPRGSLCCRPVDSKKGWLDVGPGSRVWFEGGKLRTVEGVGIFRCLPTIVGTQAGVEPVLPMSGREVIAGVEDGTLVDGRRWR